MTIPAGASQAPFIYTDTLAGPQRLTLSSPGLLPGSASVTVSPAAAATIALSPGNAAVSVTGSVTFTVTVRDVYGNSIGNAPLAWSAVGGVGTINSGGVFTAGTKSGAGTVTVESGGLTATAAVFVRPGALDHVVVIAESSQVSVGGAAVVHAFAEDAYGNLVPDATFAWTIDGPGTLSATSGGFVTVTATGEGTIHVTAAAGTASKAATLTSEAATPPTGGASSPVLVGVGGVIAGLVVGLGVGWFLARRRRHEPESPPKEEQA